MTQSSGLHEPVDDLSPEVVDRHRANVSLQEEFEAIDWYDQRVSATGDAELADILAHNRDDEKEHAAMVLEWLRRKDPPLLKHVPKHPFPHRAIPAPGPGAADGGEGSGSLGIGSLRGTGS